MTNNDPRLPDGELDTGLLEHLQSDDPLGVIIRGHLYIEARLTQIIEYRFPKPNYLHLESQHVHFKHKLDLAAAIGWISKETHGALGALNTLRNHIAHRRHFKITEQDGLNLINATRQIKDLRGKPLIEAYSWFNPEVTSKFDNLRKSIWFLYGHLTDDASIAQHTPKQA